MTLFNAKLHSWPRFPTPTILIQSVGVHYQTREEHIWRSFSVTVIYHQRGVSIGSFVTVVFHQIRAPVQFQLSQKNRLEDDSVTVSRGKACCKNVRTAFKTQVRKAAKVAKTFQKLPHECCLPTSRPVGQHLSEESFFILPFGKTRRQLLTVSRGFWRGS